MSFLKKNLPAFLFLAFLAAVVIWNFCTPDRAFSEAENRPLAGRPALSLDTIKSGDFMKQFDTWLSDQFAGRDLWVGMKAGFATNLGQRESGGIYLAGDRLIPRVDEPDAKLLEANLSAVETLRDKSPAPVTLMLVPSAAAVYSELLPKGAPSYDEGAFLQQASERFGADFCTPYPLLSDHREEELYYRTDHHWTTLGAYYGYRTLAEALDLSPLPLDLEKVVSDHFRGTSVSASGLYDWPPDRIIQRVEEPEGLAVTRTEGGVSTKGSLYDFSALDQKDAYRFFLGGNHPLITLETGHDGPRLLVVRDSYFNSLVPYLLPHFSSITLVDLRYYRDGMAALLENCQADQVVVAFSVSNFISDANLVLAGT